MNGLSLCMLSNLNAFVGVSWLFLKINFKRKSFRNTIRVSNVLDSDQGRWRSVCKGLKQTTKISASNASYHVILKLIT